MDQVTEKDWCLDEWAADDVEKHEWCDSYLVFKIVTETYERSEGRYWKHAWQEVDKEDEQSCGQAAYTKGLYITLSASVDPLQEVLLPRI